MVGSEVEELGWGSLILVGVGVGDVVGGENEVGYWGKYLVNDGYDVMVCDDGFKILG